jgi:hypothetical protein
MRRWFLSYNSQDLGLMQSLEAALRRKDPPYNARVAAEFFYVSFPQLRTCRCIGFGPQCADFVAKVRDERNKASSAR